MQGRRVNRWFELGEPNPAQLIGPLFEGFDGTAEQAVSPTIKAELAEGSTLIRVLRGKEAYFQDGPKNTSLFYIVDGLWRAETIIDSRTVTLARLGDQAIFGEVETIDGGPFRGHPNVATVWAEREGHVVKIPFDLYEACEARSDALRKNMRRLLARRIFSRALDQYIASYSAKDALLQYLRDQMNAVGIDETGTFRKTITIAELMAVLNVTRQRLNQIVRQEAGLAFDARAGQMRILDPKILQEGAAAFPDFGLWADKGSNLETNRETNRESETNRER